MSAPTVATARTTVENAISKPAASTIGRGSDEAIEAATGPPRLARWRLALPSQSGMPDAHRDSDSAHLATANHAVSRDLISDLLANHCAPCVNTRTRTPPRVGSARPGFFAFHVEFETASTE